MTCCLTDITHPQAALKQRDTIQMEYEVTLEELSRKRGEKEEVCSDYSVAQNARVLPTACTAPQALMLFKGFLKTFFQNSNTTGI